MMELKSVLKNKKEFKNYKALCLKFRCKIQSGTAKKSQLKELDTLCKWRKEQNKIIIEEVYQKN